MIAIAKHSIAVFILLALVMADNLFIRLISGQVSISDSSVVEYASSFDTPVINKYTIFGWIQFTGTENRLYNVLKFRNLGTNAATTLPDSLNSILSISYSFNQIENSQFIAVVDANGAKQSDSLAKVIEGPMCRMVSGI